MQAELIEIDENLCRSELTASQRSSYTKRRKVIWEAMHPPASQKLEQVKDELPIEPNSGAACATIPERGRGRPPEFAAETAAITGESKSQVNRHLARAEALGDDLDRLQGTSLDKDLELDALKAARGLHRARCKAGPAASRRKPDCSLPHQYTAAVCPTESPSPGIRVHTGRGTLNGREVQAIARPVGEHQSDVGG